jgi:PEP-CTERM motif
MRKILLAGTLLAGLGALISPASASNTAITIWNAANPGDSETAIGVGQANLASSDFDGVSITLSRVNRLTNPNGMTEANINIDNNTDSVQVLRIIGGVNGLFGATHGFTLTGTVGGQNGVSDLMGSFYADGGNTLNGENFSIIGSLLKSFDSGGLSGTQSFSFNGFGPDALNGPYGLAESLTLTLQPGAGVFVQGMSMSASAVPEPGTWAMGVVGFALMAGLGWKRSRKDRLAVSIA